MKRVDPQLVCRFDHLVTVVNYVSIVLRVNVFRINTLRLCAPATKLETRVWPIICIPIEDIQILPFCCHIANSFLWQFSTCILWSTKLTSRTYENYEISSQMLLKNVRTGLMIQNARSKIWQPSSRTWKVSSCLYGLTIHFHVPRRNIETF